MHLAHGAEVFAILRSVDNLDGGVIDEQVAVDIEVDVERNSVLLTVAVPYYTPDGTLVIIKNVWIAGFPVILNELSSTITVGFNHAPAPKGMVLAAAYDDDLPFLNAVLQNGGSTEEKKRKVCAKAGRGGVVGIDTFSLPL